MTLAAVIFDWGGTLTPWHTVDDAELWRSVCARHFPADQHDRAAALHVAVDELWRGSGAEHAGATIFDAFGRVGIEPAPDVLASYRQAWEPHTFTDDDAPGVLRHLRERGIRTGVLSNTLWPRSWHEDVFRRDGVQQLIDGAVYSSEIGFTKPHPEAFLAAMAAIGVTDPRICVFVGDRPWDDIYGAKQLGMRAVLVPHSDVPGCDEAEPDAVIERLSELPALIDSWSGR